jgi:glycosyltransferase involved in cell wall biosynthesis
VLPSVLVAARLEGVPAVVFAAEIYEQEWKAAPLLRLWGRLLARITAGLSAGIVCCSAAVASQFPAPRRKPVVVAYPPIDPAYADGDRRRGRERLGLGDDEPCLAVVGSISRGRGQDVAIRALALIRGRVPDARLAIVGESHPRPADQDYARELRGLVSRLGLADAVIFAGQEQSGQGMAAMADVYAAADVVVNPARFAEPFGRVAPEALVAGRPVVATRVGGVPEVLRAGTDALLVAPEDPAALAGAVVGLLEDPELARRLVQHGRTRVLAEFGADQDLAAWRRVLDPILLPAR